MSYGEIYPGGEVSVLDLDNAAAVRADLSNHFGIEFAPTPVTEKINAYGSIAGRCYFAVVITCRNITWGQYSTIKLVRSAYDALMKAAAQWEFPLFAVRTSEGQLHVLDIGRLDHPNLRWQAGGRTKNRRAHVLTEDEMETRVPNHLFDAIPTS